MRKWIGWLLALCLAGAATTAWAAEEPHRYYFPYLEGAEPLYIMEFLTLAQHPAEGEPLDDHFYAYEYYGSSRVSLGIRYESEWTTHAYSEQHAQDALYGYRLDFADVPREDVITAKTFESGVQWPASQMGGVTEAYLVGGETFYFMLDLHGEDGNIPYSRTEVDASALAIGERMTLPAAFDFAEYAEAPFAFTVEKVALLRDLPAPTPEPTSEETPTPEPSPATLDTQPQIDTLLETQSQPTEQDLPTPPPSAPPLAEPEPPARIGTIRVTNDRLVNVREAANDKADIVAKADPDAAFDCLSQAENGWYEILLPDGRTGFISPKMVKFTPAF